VEPDFVIGYLDSILNSPSTLPKVNLEVKTEVLTDVSHIALDFSGFFSPSKSLTLFASLLGRMIVLYTDTILPDHSVPPEELVVQLFLLGINLNDIMKLALINQQSQN
jgi:hypothetical protein